MVAVPWEGGNVPANSKTSPCSSHPPRDPRQEDEKSSKATLCTHATGMKAARNGLERSLLLGGAGTSSREVPASAWLPPDPPFF